MVTGVAAFIVGKWSDRVHNRKTPMHISMFFLFVSLLMTSFANDDIYFWSTVTGFANSFANIFSAFSFTVASELGLGYCGKLKGIIIFFLGFSIKRIIFSGKGLDQFQLMWIRDVAYASARTLGCLLVAIPLYFGEDINGNWFVF